MSGSLQGLVRWAETSTSSAAAAAWVHRCPRRRAHRNLDKKNQEAGNQKTNPRPRGGRGFACRQPSRQRQYLEVHRALVVLANDERRCTRGGDPEAQGSEDGCAAIHHEVPPGNRGEFT